MFELIREDIQAKLRQSLSPGDCTAWFCVAFSRGSLAVMVYRFSQWSKKIRIPVVSQLLKAIYFVLFYFIQMFTGISIQAYAKIGRRFVVRNHTCTFVLAETIGSDCTVCEGVTIGNIRGKSRLPILGDNVYLEPGCKILGDITIGNNVVVRANSLVLSDVPDNSIAIGNPARVMPLQDAVTS